MSNVYIATLGERPEAISIAYHALRERYHFEQIVIVHTSRTVPLIDEAYQQLATHFESEKIDIPVRGVETRFSDGRLILDTDSQPAVEAYYQCVLDILLDYRKQGYNLHLMIAGGRKTMSAFAIMAATLVFDGERDHAWMVISSKKLLALSGQFTIPPGMREEVKLVSLPIMSARLAPGADPRNYLDRLRQSPKHQFLGKLTPKQQEVTEMLAAHPYASNDELADMLTISPRTVENHLRVIYQTMQAFLDGIEEIPDRSKRTYLIQLLSN